MNATQRWKRSLNNTFDAGGFQRRKCIRNKVVWQRWLQWLKSIKIKARLTQHVGAATKTATSSSLLHPRLHRFLYWRHKLVSSDKFPAKYPVPVLMYTVAFQPYQNKVQKVLPANFTKLKWAGTRNQGWNRRDRLLASDSYQTTFRNKKLYVCTHIHTQIANIKCCGLHSNRIETRDCNVQLNFCGTVTQKHSWNRRDHHFSVCRAGLWPKGPIASNRAPRWRGPRATPTRTYIVYRSCLCGVPTRGPPSTVFLRRGAVANETQSELRRFETLNHHN